MTDIDPDHLYEKCRDCHLFVEPNDDARCRHCLGLLNLDTSVDDCPQGYMDHWSGRVVYEHLHRGDDVDEALASSHQAEPSGRKANLLAWKTYGPLPMRERFVA